MNPPWPAAEGRSQINSGIGMMKQVWALLIGCLAATASATNPSWIAWQRDEGQAFAQAAATGRPVLLYLEAVWCHWCHVMDAETYADEDVASLIAEHYVPLRIDQDSRPDLSARYRDIGWPATIIFDATGRELAKRQGYVPRDAMLPLLRQVLAEPAEVALTAAVAAVEHPGSLSEALRDELLRRHRDSVDMRRGGLRMAQRYLDRDSVEYSLARALAGDRDELARARVTLDAALALMDPVWGGVYQYSTGGDWSHPHYEKLTALQAEYLRIYALAFAVTREPRYRDAVVRIESFLRRFMRDPAGGFRVSQDADLQPGEHAEDYFSLDDAGRRARGIPRVDPARYTRENGQLIEAWAFWHEVSGDPQALREAVELAEWLLAHRRRSEGGFVHDAREAGGLFLADQLGAMRGLVQLYRVTGDRRWMQEAQRTAAAVDAALRAPAGYLAGPAAAGPIVPVVPLDESIALTRVLARLARYTGDASIRGMAEHAMRHLSHPAVALSRFTDVGIVLADDELRSDPLHLTIRGGKSDPEARALFEAALRVPAVDKRLEWWDAEEGPLPNPDIRYPKGEQPAAFVCSEGRCSLPIIDPAEIAVFVAELRTAPEEHAD